MNARIAAAFAAAVLLAACGSSSKSDPPPSGPAVRYAGSLVDATLTSTTDKSALVSAAAGMAQGMGGAVVGLGSVGTAVSRRALRAAEAPGPSATIRGALLQAQDAFARRDLPVAAGTVVGISGPCNGGGSVSIVASQAVQNQSTAGDYVALSFQACSDGQGGVQYGSFKMTIAETTGDAFVADATSIAKNEAFGLALVFHDFASRSQDGSWSGVDGNLDISFVATVDTVVGGTGSLEYQISGASLVSASGPAVGTVTKASKLEAFQELERELYSGIGTPSATVTEGQWSLDAHACSLEFMGCLDLLTDPTFAQHASATYPYAGALKVSDALGDFVRVTAVDESGDVTLDWDILGVTSTVDTTWGCLDGTATCP
jgi:hypothetical protein